MTTFLGNLRLIIYYKTPQLQLFVLLRAKMKRGKKAGYFHILSLKISFQLEVQWSAGMQVRLSSELSKHVFLPGAKTISNIPFKHCDQTDKLFKLLCCLNETKLLFLEKQRCINIPRPASPSGGRFLNGLSLDLECVLRAINHKVVMVCDITYRKRLACCLVRSKS